MTNDMPSSVPNTSLMKATMGTPLKAASMGGPSRSAPRSSATPPAAVRVMRTPGVGL